jgi:nicotinate-nucleotide adenylyltransferase
VRHGLPKAEPGLRVGLLGGSFDPPHQGHVNITLHALKRFGLDRVWWLVSPGNPLKREGPADLAMRMAACRAIMRHPRVAITDIEAQFGTRYTAATLNEMLAVYPGVRFVWLMGADNLAQFHHWQRWDWIMETVPIGVLARPGERISARLSPAARAFYRFRVPAARARLLPGMRAPAWCFLNVPMLDISSTAIRRRGDWVRRA